jgi:hypothetical protein
MIQKKFRHFLHCKFYEYSLKDGKRPEQSLGARVGLKLERQFQVLKNWFGKLGTI